MSDLKVHVGMSASPQAMGDRFIAAWNAAAQGQLVDERHLSFGTLQQAASLLTARRLDVLRSIHAEPAGSIRAVAHRLKRDYRNVHADVTALIDHGLIDRDDSGGLRADYAGISIDLGVAL